MIDFSIAIESLNKIKFKKLVDVKMGDAFQIYQCFNLDSVSTLKQFFKVVLQSLFDFTKTVKNNSCQDHIFFFNSRNDMRGWFEKLAQIIPMSVFIDNVFTKKRAKFAAIFVFPIWLLEMKNVNMPLKFKLILVNDMLIAYRELNLVQWVSNTCISASFVCDFQCVDSIISQYSNAHDLKTVCLEHGIYSRNSKGKPFSIANSKSQYLLIYGEFIRNECRICGIDDNRMVNVGTPKLLISSPEKRMKIKSTRTLGVILDGGSNIDNDIHMIRVVLSCAKSIGYKVFVKLHPANKKSEYGNSFPEHEIDRVVTEETNVIEFSKLVDYEICFGSTVFIDNLINLMPTFVFRSDYKPVLYDLDGLEFHDSKQLEMLLKQYADNPISLEQRLIQIREYYTVTKSVNENYMNFYALLKKGNL
jgi:hypothetical protein